MEAAACRKSNQSHTYLCFIVYLTFPATIASHRAVVKASLRSMAMAMGSKSSVSRVRKFFLVTVHYLLVNGCHAVITRSRDGAPLHLDINCRPVSHPPHLRNFLEIWEVVVTHTFFLTSAAAASLCHHDTIALYLAIHFIYLKIG